MASQKNNKNKANLRKEQRKPSLEETLLETYKGIIAAHPKENKFFCLLCKKHGSTFFAGLWHNCKEHLTSASHKRSEEKELKDLKNSKEDFLQLT